MTKSQRLATLAILIALITILTFVPLQFGPINLAVLLLIPVFVGCQTQGLKVALILGLYAGLLSLIASYTVSTSLLRFVFNNPLVSVIPRILVGLLTYISYTLMLKALKKFGNDKVKVLASSFVSSVIGILTNTVLVLGLMFALYNGTNYSGVTINAAFIWSIVLSNSVVELCVCSIVTPPIVYGLNRAKLNNIKKSI